MTWRIACLVVAVVFIIYTTGCSKDTFPLSEEPEKPVCTVAIDIDDIFQPNWDNVLNTTGTVKMEESDILAIVDLTAMIRSRFGGNFMFSLGYNSGFFDSTNTGDRAFLDHAAEFVWFNHFPRHEHVVGQSLSYNAIDSLFQAGRAFEDRYGLRAFVGGYMVTPLHEGLWPPYIHLYDAFENYGITATSTPMVSRPASYGSVRIAHRTFLGLSSSQYSLAQVSLENLSLYARAACDSVLANTSVIFYTHQANYARDRVANELIAQLVELLATQDDYTIKFVIAEEAVKRYSGAVSHVTR